MMSQANVVPPRVATYLVNLFIPAEEAELILGDLLEEYSHLRSESGIAFARRWYWRQTLKTIANLTVAGYRAAPGVHYRRNTRRLATEWFFEWLARQGTERCYRQIPLVLVESFRALRVLWKRNVDRKVYCFDPGGGRRRVCYERKGDVCHDDSKSRPRRYGCYRLSRHGAYRSGPTYPFCGDGMELRRAVRNRHWRSNRPNAQISYINSALRWII
jgi:hypothetical protein